MNNQENNIKKFFNERIKIQGDKEFRPEINDKNDSALMILDFLKKNINPNKIILDAGCGEGRFSKYFIDIGSKITSMDFSEEYIRLAKKNIMGGKFIVGSVTNIPLKTNSFDYVFCIDVLQHVPDIKKAIEELHRILKRGGKLIIIDKNKFGLHKKYLIPKCIIQKYRESTEVRYSSFKERWFQPEKLKKDIIKYFDNAKYEYLIENNKNSIFKLFPKLNHYVAWTAIK